ncbi:MAG: hypothetical protein ABSH15_12525 [Verrucomicrobiota bacterium]|jgi:hypothetical protein
MTDKLNKFLESTKPLQGLLALVIIVSGAIVWIRISAQNAVLDEKFLATLAARVRPTCIFDSRGAVEADFGASDYIEDIQVIPEPKDYAKNHKSCYYDYTGIAEQG